MMLFTEPMMAAGVIMLLTFFGIFTEQFHGIERAKFALAGAGIIILVGQWYGFYSPEQALTAIDWNVVFLLATMMIIIAIMVSTGGFERVAHFIAVYSKGSQVRLLLLSGTVISVMSMVLDNVTTVIIFSPLLILICQQMRISPIPYLMAAALLSNTGGVATLVGDPPNLMIGSAANIDFNTFFIHMAPPVWLAWCAMLVGIFWIFRRALSKIAQADYGKVEPYHNRILWLKSVAVLLMMIVLFVFHSVIHWQPWMVAGACLTLLLFWARKVELEKVTNHLEEPLLIFFIALFILIGGVDASGLLTVLGQRFTPLILDNPALAALVLLWVAALFSALIDNIPFTAAMIPVLLTLESQGVNVSVLWWSLALGVGLGGNASHIGSTANVYVVTMSERLAREQHQPELAITPAYWVQNALPITLLSLVVASLFLFFGYDYLYIAH